MHGVVAAAVKMKVDTTKCKDAKSMGQAYLQDPKKAVHQSEFEKLPQWATKVNLKQNKYVLSVIYSFKCSIGKHITKEI